MRVFVDSDVVISSLLSSSGAASFLLGLKEVIPVISSVSLLELRSVVSRLGINPSKLETLVSKRFEVVTLKSSIQEIKKECEPYVIDIGDAHIVAGAKESGVQYLISYNIRHFKVDNIKDDFEIILLTPALFIQYLRSR
jgi:predicted nucleic acid-binding protein